MAMKRGTVILLVFTVCGIGPAHATIPVFDYTAFSQQLLHYISLINGYTTQLRQYQTQIQTYVTQYEQLQYTVRNATNYKYQLNLSSLDHVQGMMNSAVGISYDAGRMQTQFETLYPDFKAYENYENRRTVNLPFPTKRDASNEHRSTSYLPFPSKKDSQNYSDQAIQWAQVNQGSALDTLRVQSALRANLVADRTDLQTLSNRSKSAAGTKDLLQIANQLMVLQIKQLMHLEQLLMALAKADSAYMAEQASKDAASAARSRRASESWKTKGNKRVNTGIEKLR